MQIKNKYSIMIMSLLVLAAGSCRKLVDVGDPVNSVTTTSVFKTNAQANSALAAIYARMMTNTGKMVFSNGAIALYTGLSADELVNFAGTNNNADYQFASNSLLAANASVDGALWQPAYKCIYDANAALEGLSASASGLLSDSMRKELTGEAKFIRAFCYFNLINLFGDVPLALVTDFNKTALMKRTPQAEVYLQIIQDLKDAQGLLAADFSPGGGERIRPNKWAATALLARVYLYLQRWEEAETQATAVINSSLFGLAPALTNVFLKNSNEAIWQLQQSTSSSYYPNNSTWDGINYVPLVLFYSLPPAQQTMYMANYSVFRVLIIPSYYCTPQLTNTFEPGDKRRTQWLDSVPNPSGPALYHPFKYTLQSGTVGGTILQYYMVFRLAEQYLIRAEARAQLGKTGADADLNAVRNRAGLPNTSAATPAALLVAIAHERQVELFAEWGHRWMDLKRTGQAMSVLTAAGKTITPNGLLYPIPQGELSADPNLTQNSGY